MPDTSIATGLPLLDPDCLLSYVLDLETLLLRLLLCVLQPPWPRASTMARSPEM